MTTKEKLEQLEKILHGRTLHGSESLKAFLRFVGEKTVDNGDGGLKEYVIATEVFGRNSDYNSRIDSVVRVQASRLRTKLHEYYTTEGKSDHIVIDLPKGHYTPTFAYKSDQAVGNGSAEPAEVPGKTYRTDSAVSKLNLWMTVSLVAAILLAALLGAMLWRVNSEKTRLSTAFEPESQVAVERQASLPLWGDLLEFPGTVSHSLQ